MLVNIPEEIAAAYRQQARKTRACAQELIIEVLEQNAPSNAPIDVLNLDAPDSKLVCLMQQTKREHVQ